MCCGDKVTIHVVHADDGRRGGLMWILSIFVRLYTIRSLINFIINIWQRQPIAHFRNELKRKIDFDREWVEQHNFTRKSQHLIKHTTDFQISAKQKRERERENEMEVEWMER